MALAKTSGEGSMWGSGDEVSAISSTAKKTAPGICACRYSAWASRLRCGR